MGASFDAVLEDCVQVNMANSQSENLKVVLQRDPAGSAIKRVMP